MVPVRGEAGVDKEAVVAAGKTPGCDAGDSPRSALLLQAGISQVKVPKQ